MPEDDGWERFDGPDAEDELDEVELAEVFVEDDVLVTDARGRRSVSFHRAVDARGLAPAYRLGLDVRTVGQGSLLCLVIAEPPICFEVGFYTGAMIQDRMIMVLGEIDTADALNVVLLVDSAVAPEGFVRLGQVPRDAFHTLTVSAVRDGNVHVEAGGEVLGVVGWGDLPQAGDVTLDVEEPPEVGPDEVSVLFGVGLARAEWRRVAYEVCLAHNLDVQVVSTAPEDPGSVVLRGGTGQTLAGFEQLHGTLTRVTALHRSFDAPSEGEIVLSDTTQDVTFLAATDDGTPRRFAAFDVPPGEVSQLRFHVEDVTLDLDGVSHDVRVGSGAQSGIKVIPEGGRLVIPEDETVSLAVDFDLTSSLSHNRGRGFMLDPVVVSAPALPPLDPAPPAPEPPLRPDIPRPPVITLPTPPFSNMPGGVVLDIRAAFGAPEEETLLAFEETFDVILIREQKVRLDLDGLRIEFVPSALFADLNLPAWAGEPIFMGVLRQISILPMPDNGRYLGVLYAPDGAGGHQVDFVDSDGGLVLTAPIDGENITPFPEITYSDLDEIPWEGWEPPETDVLGELPELPDPDFEFDDDGLGQPEIIALVHGRTLRPEDVKDQLIGTVHHALIYWGFDFVAELLGVPGATFLETFEHSVGDATRITRDEWDRGGYSEERLDEFKRSKRELRRLDLAILAARLAATHSTKRCLVDPFCRGCCGAAILAWAEVARLKSEREELLEVIDELRVPDIRVGEFVYHPSQLVTDPLTAETAPERVVMLTHRDGSLSLGAQSKALTRQVSVLYDRLVSNVYPSDTGLFPAGSNEPLILFVSHSMGGLALRYVLSRPVDEIAGPAFDEEELLHAAELARRTVAVVTLQTPHEGSAAADSVVEMSEGPILTLLNVLYYVMAIPLVGPGFEHTPRSVFNLVTGADMEATEHLQTTLWATLNTRPLSPHLARRPDGSLIPIYTIAGRTPSAGYFNIPGLDWESRDGWQGLLNRLRGVPGVVGQMSNTAVTFVGGTRTVTELHRISEDLGPNVMKETAGLMAADGMHVRIDDSWGPPIPDARESLDVVRRTPLEGTTVLDIFPHLYLRPEPGLEQDVDGFVATGTGLGVQLGTTVTDFFSHDALWSIEVDEGIVEEMRGSWYRIYFSDEEWDFANHSSIRSSQDAGQWLRREILNLAGPYVGEGGVSAWRQQ